MTNHQLSGRHVYEQTFVRSLFDSIAHRYDFLNHTLSSGIDIIWRRRAIKLLQPFRPKQILDVATGTADFALEAVRLNPERIFGIDISPKMLERGRHKIRSRKLEQLIILESGEAEHLRFESGSFDVVMAAFGVRNFANLELGLKEFYRVLHSGGVAMILEFSKPKRFPIKQMFRFYSRYVLPLLGEIISNNRSAYEYLPSTVAEFPDGEEFCALLRSAGFTTATCSPQTFGIASIYIAMKELSSK
ncbi:MAG: bifunctional demethylmenaquinone methyltransferase/2-methoxy-6-polyprenyl-1,4-benzoquinol methylase UbiE [Bacteroidota bacterium]|jgi:demethylmenaquinone methyltransferase/2-methoxy-6-polyprenyl-1,4-benzoquinol methylase